MAEASFQQRKTQLLCENFSLWGNTWNQHWCLTIYLFPECLTDEISQMNIIEHAVLYKINKKKISSNDKAQSAHAF